MTKWPQRLLEVKDELDLSIFNMNYLDYMNIDIELKPIECRAVKLCRVVCHNRSLSILFNNSCQYGRLANRRITLIDVLTVFRQPSNLYASMQLPARSTENVSLEAALRRIASEF